MIRTICLGLLAATVAIPALAQAPQPRVLPVSADAPFLHKLSGVTLPVGLAGLTRAGVREVEGPELDIVGNWTGHDDEELSIYVYRSTVGSVPLWFDRTAWAIGARGVYGTPTLDGAVSAIAVPGAATEAGLIAGWTPSKGPYAATAAAILPVGEWLVKLRYSSKHGDGHTAVATLRSAITGMGWPATIPAAPPAQPIADCPAPLAFKGEAKSVKADMSTAILGAFGGALMASGEGKKPAMWCRDRSSVEGFGVYRADGATDRYLLALSDAGRGVVVGPSGLAAILDPKARPNWSVDLVLPGRTITYPPQDRLPSPQRVAQVLRGPALSSASTWGGKRSINLSNGVK